MISVIIPTYNEANIISSTIRKIRLNDIASLISEIIIVDGGSTDNTLQIAKKENAIAIVSPKKGRAVQLNFGATFSNNKILYFLHSDTIPPLNFTTDIIKSIQEGNQSGCFTLKFDYPHWFLKVNSWFTKFNINAFRFGDQSLFVTKEIFDIVGGYNENLIIMEDQEIIKKIKNKSAFKIISTPVTTSARKYLENGIFKTQAIFFLILSLYYLGYSQNKLVKLYRYLLHQNKV